MNMTSEENMQEVAAAQEKDSTEVQTIANETAGIGEEDHSAAIPDNDTPRFKGNFYRFRQRMAKLQANPFYMRRFAATQMVHDAFNELMSMTKEARSRIMFHGQTVLRSKENVAKMHFSYDKLRVTWTRQSFA